MKIVADKAIPFVERFFSTLGEVVLLDGRDIAVASIGDADCLVVRSITRVGRELLAGSRIKCVASATSGIDHVDLDYLYERDIPLFDAKGCNAAAVAEYVLSSLFVLSDQCGVELQGKTVGIIGCGNVGGRLRQSLSAIGIETLVYDPFIRDQDNCFIFRELNEVLEADVITLHVPLTTVGEYPTFRMVERDFLDRLREDVILINTARGGIVNERDLLRFSRQNQTSRLVLDVWDNEPHINPELFEAATIATPHIAGYSLDAKVNAIRMLYEKVCRWVDSRVQADATPLLPAELVELNVAEFDRDLEAIQMAVLASYDVRSDCAALREAREFEPDKQAALFDSLRANYPPRREFPAMRVGLPGNPGPLHDKFSSLGFTVKTTEP